MIAVELAAWSAGPLTVPDRVCASVRRHLVDGFGVALAAVRLDAASPAVTVARGLGGPPEATIIGTDARGGAAAAALANGTLVHALDFDDTHASGLVHATAIVLPAAFAVGQERSRTGAEVLDAAVVGLEVACRVPSAAPHQFHARGLHATMVAGVFSAAAVAARLMGLTPEQTTAALGIAGSQAGGLLAFLATGASTKQLHPGLASQSGILAARLAAAGASGPETVFDGPHSVFDALAGGQADPASIVADLGTRWESERIGIKPYPVCQLSHATLDAVATARRTHGFGPGDVARIEADVHPDSAPTVCDGSRDLAAPASAYAAKFSLPWCVAALLVDGVLGLDAFEPERLARPEIAELASRVTWRLTDGAGHAADAAGHVRITLLDGAVVEGEVVRSGGGPDNPLTRDEVRAKAIDNGGPAAEAVADLVERLEELDSVEPVLDATRTTD